MVAEMRARSFDRSTSASFFGGLSFCPTFGVAELS